MSAPPSACPFHALWAGKEPATQQGDQQSHVQGAAPPSAPPPPPPAAAAAANPAAPGAAQCPYLAGVSGMSVQDGSAAQAESGGAATAAASPAAPTDDAPAAGAASAPASAPAGATCPLGFGSSRRPALGEFHCALCRSLYHDCVKAAPCSHRFCAGCIRGARDCPLCGADVEGVQADGATQALVERYIDAHAGSHTIWELEGASGQEVEGMAGERSCAAFLLQLGLRSIAAGNTAAARARFEQCQAELEQQVEAGQQQQAAGAGTDNQPAGGSGPADVLLLCRLGAVRGCLGDCCRAEGDAEGTLAHYQESVRLLQAAGDDAEATQALSVALNKVGELRHLQGDLAAAAEQYAAALRLRRALLAARQRQWAGEGSGEPREGGSGAAAAAAGEEAGAGSEACCSAALDLAASCLKLSGARAGLGESGEAEALLTEAEALLQGLDAPGQLAAQPERLRRKQASLAQFAAMMQRQRQQQQVLDKRQ